MIEEMISILHFFVRVIVDQLFFDSSILVGEGC